MGKLRFVGMHHIHRGARLVKGAVLEEHEVPKGARDKFRAVVEAAAAAVTAPTAPPVGEAGEEGENAPAGSPAASNQASTTGPVGHDGAPLTRAGEPPPPPAEDEQ